MTHKPQSGFSLIELLAVVAILGFLSTTISLTSHAISQPSVEQLATQLEELLLASRRKAMLRGLPAGVSLVSQGVIPIVWLPHSGAWSTQDNQILSVPEDMASIDLEVPHTSNYFYPLVGSPTPLDSDGFIIFWPNGTSTGATLSVSAMDQTPASLSVSPLGDVY